MEVSKTYLVLGSIDGERIELGTKRGHVAIRIVTGIWKRQETRSIEGHRMNLIPSLMSGCNSACLSPKPGSLLFINLHVTPLVLLSTSAPAKIISAKVWNGLGFVVCEYLFEQVHLLVPTKSMSKSKAYFISWHLPALFVINPIAGVNPNTQCKEGCMIATVEKTKLLICDHQLCSSSLLFFYIFDKSLKIHCFK